MVLILRCLLVVVNNIIINFEETIHHGLFLTSILATSNSGTKLSQDLITITQIVLHSSCTGLIVIHVEHLTKIHGCTKRSSVTT
uniref:AC5 protein n=2 Tax=Mungbean yellow mosaic India virus TaxID=223287 RepID=C7TP67_9GEMI|nr:AC5 [Mungbean yellow mosaic India virus-[Cowpea]]QZX44710.1 AC5 [Mungbean yellow mosaic India virus]UTQ10582.1 AC5 protein [Mungbean yellow mosaic India virus]UTQ10596.1 AC5 protein [Mungbean yellow mosaic India virus]UTQ10624.1 AC5 protein [Mungbean yellow mosaic India virus]